MLFVLVLCVPCNVGCQVRTNGCKSEKIRVIVNCSSSSEPTASRRIKSTVCELSMHTPTSQIISLLKSTGQQRIQCILNPVLMDPHFRFAGCHSRCNTLALFMMHRKLLMRIGIWMVHSHAGIVCLMCLFLLPVAALGNRES